MEQNNLTNLNTPKQKYFNKQNLTYRFKYKLSDFTSSRALANAENITFSKAIGIGLNYLRTHPQAEKISINKVMQHESTEEYKKNTTTIALTEKNYNYLMSKEKHEKYLTLLKANYYAPLIYKKKNDQIYKLEQELLMKGKTK